MTSALTLEAVAPQPIERARAYVHPGHSFYSTAPTVVTTILGSCVSVCFFDDAARIGGITHYVLPRPLTGPNMLQAEKIGTTAIIHLYESLICVGANAQRLKAKVFGGASMHAQVAGSARDLGGQNATVAFEILTDLRVPIVSHDTGGTRGRKLVFHSDDGSAWIKYLEGGR